MFSFFSNRIYGSKVILRVESLLVEYLGQHEGGEAIGGFIGTTQLLEQMGRFDLNDVLKRLRVQGLSVDDAAISLIDGTVTSLRRLSEEADSREAMESLVPLLERALDIHMKTRPGRVVPRNGLFGRAATEHLAPFLKETGA